MAGASVWEHYFVRYGYESSVVVDVGTFVGLVVLKGLAVAGNGMWHGYGVFVVFALAGIVDFLVEIGTIVDILNPMMYSMVGRYDYKRVRGCVAEQRH